MLAAFAICISRTCCTSDLVVPFLGAGRSHSRLADVVGFFAHYLHLRIRLTDTMSLLDALECVNKQLNAAIEHSDAGRVAKAMPEMLVGGGFSWEPWLSSFKERTSGNPVEPPKMKAATKNEKLKIRRFSVDPMVQRDDERFDLDMVLGLSEGGQGIGGACFYRADLFQKATMERFARNLRLFVTLFIESPEMLVQACPLEAT